MKYFVSMAALAAIAGLASAAPITINEAAVGGGSFNLNPGNLTPQVFSAPSPNFTNGSMGFIHNQLQGDGIVTNNVITIMAGRTDDGLALFALLDDDSGVFTSFNSRMDMVAVAQDNNNVGGITGWVNDNGGELIQAANSNPIAGTYTFNTTFQWDNRTKGDGFALSKLELNDSGSLVFNPLNAFGLAGVANGFQYVSWENGQWVVVGTGNFNNVAGGGSSTSLDWRVIPLPGAGAMSLAGLALVGARRRRAL